MAATFDRHIHTHVTVTGLADQMGPLPIIHAPQGRVWIMVTYADALPRGVLPVGDGTCNGYDNDGNRVVSVPVGMCSFHTEDEAEQIAALMDADEYLLACAR